MKKENIVFLSLIVLFTILCRIVPHLPNFTPIAALGIWGVAYLNKKTMWLPIVALFLSDLIMGFYDIKLMIVVYASFVLVALLGLLLRNKKSFSKFFGVSILGSIIFFLTTNFAVWTFSSWYAKDLSGLINCYVLGLPFLRNAMLGDLFYLIAFVGVTEFVFNYSRSRNSLFKSKSI